MNSDLNFPEVYIHVGIPKTASTTLQNTFFSALPNVNYLGPEPESETPDFLKRIFLRSPRNYSQEKVVQLLKDNFTEEQPLIISNEAYAGLPVPLATHQFNNRKLMVARMKELFPDAKILIVIRNQIKFLQSFFPQMLMSSNHYIPLKGVSFKKYIDLNIKLAQEGMYNILEGIDYGKLIDDFQTQFDEVEVVVFEEIVTDLKKFIKGRLSDWMGLDKRWVEDYYKADRQNIRHRSRAAVFLERQVVGVLNRLEKWGNPHKKLPLSFRQQFMAQLHSGINKINFFKIDTEFEDAQLAFIQDYFAKSNVKVAHLLNKDLSQWGYPLL